MGVEGQDPELCGLCSYPASQHSQMKHTFVGPDQDPGAAIKNPERKKSSQTPQITVIPAPDLVLRRTLVNLGLITEDDIIAAERELIYGAQATRIHAEPDTDAGDSANRARSSTE